VDIVGRASDGCGHAADAAGQGCGFRGDYDVGAGFAEFDIDLSPMESMTPSMAVATEVPSAMAAMMSALRFGERRMESRTKRTIILATDEHG